MKSDENQMQIRLENYKIVYSFASYFAWLLQFSRLLHQESESLLKSIKIFLKQNKEYHLSFNGTRCGGVAIVGIQQRLILRVDWKMSE